jgi:hypothetical protein
MNSALDTPSCTLARGPHPLHQGERVWPETNCYMDMWVEVLHSMGFDPRAALAFTVNQDFEGDHFTFFKFPLEDLERLYGLQVAELAIFDSLEDRVVVQSRRGRVVIVEVDGFYLPDLHATTYRREHTKTAIAIDYIDPDGRRVGYFHNAGYHLLEVDDYESIFRKQPALARQPDLLHPYTEFVKRARAPLVGDELAHASTALLRGHMRRLPARNPVSEWRAEFPDQLDQLLARGESLFNLYSFNVMRQFGANFEYLSKYLLWLDGQGVEGLRASAENAQTIAWESMVMQFRVARAVARTRRDLCDDCFDVLESAYERTFAPLAGYWR